MTGTTTHFIAPDFLAVTIGIVVYLAGVAITRRVEFLRNFNIPEPVTGGVLAAVVLWLLYLAFDVEIGFDLTTRDRLLVIFFATVGVNAKLSALASGGRVPGYPVPGNRGLRVPAEWCWRGWRPAVRSAAGSRRDAGVRRPGGWSWHHRGLGSHRGLGTRLSGRHGSGHRRGDIGADRGQPARGAPGEVPDREAGPCTGSRGGCDGSALGEGHRRSDRQGRVHARAAGGERCGHPWLPGACLDLQHQRNQAAAVRALHDHGNPAFQHCSAGLPALELACRQRIARPDRGVFAVGVPRECP